MMPITMSLKDFRSRLGQEFHIEQESNKWIPTKLTEATALNNSYSDPNGADRIPFVVVFQAGADIHLLQKTYKIKHEELGEHQIFLVPIQPDDNGTRFEAVFT